MVTNMMCKRPDLAPSSAYKYAHCRCERCLKWKHNSAKRTNNKELAKKRARDWRLKYPERSRELSKNYQRLHPDKVLEWQLRKYGLTLEQYKAFGNKCMICGKEPHGMENGKLRLCVDHDHKTGRVRGLLCGACNIAIGHFYHNSELLENAIKYLQANGDVE